MLLLLFLGGIPGHAAAPPPPERGAPEPVHRAPENALKAAYLYNFTLFVDWPPEATNGSFLICVLGTDPFGPTLPEILRGKTAGGRELRSAVVASREELPPCRVVYVPATDAARHRDALQSLLGQPVLTVGETEDFLGAGGIIRLFVEGGKLRFDVNAEAARRSRLKISARLLELARGPQKGPGGGP